MLPLIYAEPGSDSIIKKIGGSAEVRQHLADLGLNAGTSVTVVSITAGNVIVKVRETRVAVSREMAQKIMI